MAPPRLGGQQRSTTKYVSYAWAETAGTVTREADAGIGLGFVAPPYPPFRLPGWERASLAVHGDDGRQYVRSNCGGKDFTNSFENDEIVGIAMVCSPPHFEMLNSG